MRSLPPTIATAIITTTLPCAESLSKIIPLLPSRQTTLIRTLLNAAHADELDPAAVETLLPINATMVTRKIWVKRPSGSPTLVTINEEDLVDDVRDMILRKYSNSLGRQFDSPDLVLKIIPREQQRQDRILGPEEPMARTLDAYFPGGQTVEEALIIDVPQRRLTPRSSPRTGPPHAQHLTSVKKTDNPALPAGMLSGGVPPINVLIVEDNIINLRLLEAFIKRLKVRWATAMNGREAVTKWRNGGFHLVLMDIQLPIMNGLDATREIRRLERINSIGAFSAATSGKGKSEIDTREETEDDILPNRERFKSPVIIVALTASSLQSDRHEALAAGCNDFLTKPVTYVWLERKVMEWGCMQALIDFDGWRQWKTYTDDDTAKKAKAKKERAAIGSHLSLSGALRKISRPLLHNYKTLSFSLTMPPRIGSSVCQSSPSSLLLLLPNSSSAAAAKQQLPKQCTLQFSTSTPREATRPQRRFRQWINRAGMKLRDHEGDQPTYLSPILTKHPEDGKLRPFPSNSDYISEPVLTDAARETIWEYAIDKNMPLKALSAQFSVDIRRIAAVLRMKAIEKKMEAANKPMAIPYAKAVEKMLPRAELRQGEAAFEPINDIHVHSYTMQQLFVPVSESREFTRADAAKAFGDHILPPDKKMRIPELIRLEKDIANRVPARVAERMFIERTAKSELAFARKMAAKDNKEWANKIRVKSSRGVEFRFERVSVDSVGKDGRARAGVGARYGVPHDDRRRGTVKIPTSVG
ncbi:eukaryotic mitochondrial regulator protein-domain-containing protein [Podospora fimiseda]|uniref:Eukaryotic mitochondrial regulator protein-domain-containing protein n=1 Tax=Podospora fimiseda TaxID=252190 RepID=A0AAN6YNU3_9PEZI|nr:eukaryotic mitochondrial regulator protein-domain-containing protein [Podospora fimiseda]